MRGFVKRGTWIGLLVVLVSAVLAASASAAFKPFSVVMSGDVGSSTPSSTPTRMCPGSATACPVAVATINNENKTQQLGSANLTAPSGYVVTSASTTQGTVTPTTMCDSTTQVCVIQLRNASLAPGQSLKITIGLTSVPCTPGKWSVQAKQANNFNGSGNDLNLDTANSVLTTTLCAVTFTNGTATTDAKPTTDDGLSGGNAQVKATAAASGGQLLESGNLATVSPVDCSPAARGGYTTADPNTFGVLATVNASKVVTITISSPTIPLVGNANKILKNQQICFEAPYEFTTFAGTKAVSESTNITPGPPPFIGLLQTCTGSTVGPCHNRQADSVITDPVTRKVTGVVLVADIPVTTGDLGVNGDPHMG